MGKRSRSRAALLAPIPLVFTLANPAAAGDSVCDPKPETEAVLSQVRQIDETCGEGDECRQEKRRLLEQALDRRQWDVFLHREHQDLLRPHPLHPATAAVEFVERYESRHRREPDRPLWLYLFGRALLLARREARPDLFERALNHDSGFAWAHLALVSVYVGNPAFQDAAKGQKHVDAFVRLCPDSPEIYTYMADGTSFERSGRGGLRALLERRLDSRTLPYYPKLWRAEFRVTPPAEHQTVRARVRADIERIRAAPLREQLEWWRTLTQAYQLTGDDAARRAVQREMVERFPCHDEAAWVRRELWDEDHPEPESPVGRRAWQRALFEAASAWAKACPDTFVYRQARFESAPDDLSDEELAAVVGEFLVSWETRGRKSYMQPSPYFMAAQKLLKRGMWLDRMEELARKGLEEAEAIRARRLGQPALPSGQRTQLDKEYGRQEWQTHSIRAQAALKRGVPGGPGPHLARLEVLLEALRPSEDDGPREKKAHRARQAEFWKLKGDVAFAEGRRSDALAYYRRALPERAWDVELREATRTLWTETGESEEGWSDWVQASGALDPGLDTGARGAWESTHRSLPDFQLEDLSGRTWSRAELAGKVGFVNVWATWCGPCIVELPYVQKLYDRLRDRGDVVLMTFNVDDNPGLVGPFVEPKGYRFPALRATDWFFRNRWNASIPQSWLIDPGGVVRYEQGSFEPSQGDKWLEDVLARISRLAAAEVSGKGPTPERRP